MFDTKWADVLSECPAEVRLEVYEAIIRYASTGTLPELKPLARMAFGFVRLQIDEQAERMRLEASDGPLVPIGENSPRGGESGGGGKEREREKEESPAPPYEEKEKEKEKVEGEATASLSPSSKEESDAVEEAHAREARAVDWQALASYWNERRGAMPRLTVWSERRRAAVRARMRESGGMEGVRAVIDRAAASDFLQGRNGRGFVADFDWVMKPSNFCKVADGNYDNRPAAAAAGSMQGMNYRQGW